MNQMPDTTNPETRGSMYLSAGTSDRAVGAVVGSAVGDALGAYYETSYPGFDEEIVMRPGGGLDGGRALGGWTDDTAMVLGVLDALASGYAEAANANPRWDGSYAEGAPDEYWVPPPIHIPAMAANFLRWYRGGAPDVGNQTARILGAADGPEDVAEMARRFSEGNPRSAGNGALMRTTAVALSHYMAEEVAPMAAWVAALTHPHPDSVDACVLWTNAVCCVIHDRRWRYDAEAEAAGGLSGGAHRFAEAIRSGLGFLPDEARRRRWERIIDAALARPDAAEARRLFTPNGWVVTAFQAALWAVVATPVRSPSQHFRDALVAAVRIGHDTDTVAAIAGGLLGARWGLAAIPDEWTRHLHGDRVRGETVTGAEFATVALQAFDCTMRRFFLVRAARHGGAWPEVLTPETIRHGKALDEWTRQCEA